jgi:hypothetical protein
MKKSQVVKLTRLICVCERGRENNDGLMIHDGRDELVVNVKRQLIFFAFCLWEGGKALCIITIDIITHAIDIEEPPKNLKNIKSNFRLNFPSPRSS